MVRTQSDMTISGAQQWQPEMNRKHHLNPRKFMTCFLNANASTRRMKKSHSLSQLED